MWSPVFLFLVVGLACSSQSPAWSEQHYYVYQVISRSLASLDQNSDHYSGILFKAQLNIQPRSDGNLGAKITNALYASIHAELEDGWSTEIPESQAGYQKLPLSESPFQIVLNNGAIHDIIVSKDIRNWEANLIKSFVSSLQLDTKPQNLIPSSINVLNGENANSAVYKTMEETGTGVHETLYEIHPYPEYVLQSQPWVVPHKQFIEEGDEVIEIVKNRNFSHSQRSPSFHVGWEGIPGYQPGNSIGNFLSRNSNTRAVVTGNRNKYLIQSSVTVEEITVSPSLDDQQRGSQHSGLNLTLSRIQQAQDGSQFEVSNPVSVGIVYSYNNPYGSENSPRPSKPYDHAADSGSAETSSPSPPLLQRRSRSFELDNSASDSAEEQDWQQDKPQINEAPPSPLLPFTVGYDGQSYKKQQDVAKTAYKLAQEIGKELLHPEEILRQQTVGKFVVLTSLVRIMDQNEIQQVASQLYSSQQNQAPSWVVFRDSVAQAGTGPALVNIKEWIQSGKLAGYEAAQVIAQATDAARQPTEEYIRALNDMIQDDKIMSQKQLNESVLLSYTNFLYQAYVDDQSSNGKYPVYSYGSFRSSRGQEFVTKEVIPHLTQKLQQAVEESDTQKIHTYIRALGNVGQQQILGVFEPYLEGHKKLSQFQRVLMILVLDNLVKSNPRAARSVCYKIYQNPSESEQVRAAAVYQLIRTRPTSSMLQRMASYTNVDTSSYVNAAVKSSIQCLSQLENPEFSNLRAAAQSALPLLTNREFGAQYSQGCGKSDSSGNSQSSYRQYLQTFGGKDSAVPKGIKYLLKKTSGGVVENLFDGEVMVSSVEDLIDVFKQQTQEYQSQQQQKQSQQPSPLSSEYIAQLLNLQNDQREQLEGNLYLHVGAFQTSFSFDNNTLENLPQEIQNLEQQLQQFKKSYNKIVNTQESTLALPTLLGLPFVYTYNRPVLVRFEGNVQANAQPSFSTGQNLQTPNSVEAEFDVQAVISGGVQTRLGIFAPFNHQQYSAGYNKNFQVVVPLNGKLALDLNNDQWRVEVLNPASQNSLRLVHYSSSPYTSQSEIYSPKPDLKIIRSQDPYRRNIVVGDKSTGVAVSIQITSDERIDIPSIVDKLRQQNPLSAWLSLWNSENIQYVHVDLSIDSAKSTSEKAVLRLGYQQAYQVNEPSGQRPDPNDQVGQIPSFPDEPEKRQNEFVNQLASYLNEGRVWVGDATVEFQGQSKITYSLTAGTVKSNAEPLGAFMGLVRKVNRGSPQYVGYVRGAVNSPNTNGLNLDYAMQMDPTSKAYIQVLLNNQQQQSRVEAQVELSKSNERVQYLKQQQEYKQCQQQMQEGNQQLPVCAAVTAKANLLDKFWIKVKYNNIDNGIVNATYKLYSLLRNHLYPRIEENIIESPANDRLEIEGQFAPDLQSLNFSISSKYGQAEVENVEVGQWTKQLLVPHPVFHLKARLQAEALKADTYRPICVVDKTKTSTFDNKTYPTNLPNAWTVLLQYVPRRPSSVPNKPDLNVTEQLHQQIESYVVLGRAPSSGSSQKEIQINVQMPSTQGKVVKISAQPRRGQPPQVSVNDQVVQYGTGSPASFYNGDIEVYALPDQEVKIEVSSAFYAIFDGETLKLTAVNSKFRDASRGLCGTFTGEPETDFLTPDNCIVSDPQEFVDSYSLHQTSGSSGVGSPQASKCYQKTISFGNYISNQDSGRSSENQRRNTQCTGHSNRYVKADGQVCFTIRPLPFCKSNCNAMGYLNKRTQVSCMDPSPSTALWTSRIDKGILTDDFSMMQPTRMISLEVPASCVP